MPYVVRWAGKYDNLHAQITISSEDGAFTQTFTEWCLWDTGAQLSMITNGRQVGGINDLGFLQMEILRVTFHFPFISLTSVQSPKI
jgi:hypothetical protein